MVDTSSTIARTDIIQQISDGFNGVIVASAEALFEKVPSSENIRQETQTIAVGQSIAISDLSARLATQDFKHVEFVAQPGELAIRGGIMDVFPFTGTFPIRIEFFGDEIDSIREFDHHSQRSISRLKSARLVPNLDASATRRHSSSTLTSIFSLLPQDCLVVSFGKTRCSK